MEQGMLPLWASALGTLAQETVLPGSAETFVVTEEEYFVLLYRTAIAPPNWFRRNGAIGAGLEENLGRQACCCGKTQYRLPWNWLVPERVTAFTTLLRLVSKTQRCSYASV